MIRSSLVSFTVAGIALLAGQSAFAGTTPGTFPVTSAVVATCVIDTSATSFAGNYDSVTNKTARLVSGAKPISFTCTKGAAVAITLDQGQNPNASSSCSKPLPQMKSPAGAVMSYAIYKDAGGTTAWGCGAGNQFSTTSTGGLTAMQVPAYIQVIAGQDMPAAVYSDTVTATLTF